MRKNSLGMEEEITVQCICGEGCKEELTDDVKSRSRAGSLARISSLIRSASIMDELKDSLLDKDLEAMDVPAAPQVSICAQHSIMVSEGLSTAVAEELLKKYGRNELEDKSDPKWLIVSAIILFVNMQKLNCCAYSVVKPWWWYFCSSSANCGNPCLA